MKIDWFAVLRDVLIVVVLGAFGTIAVTFVSGEIRWSTQLLVAFLMLIVGFAISGSLKGPGRFKHLPLVALGVWAVALLDGLLREPERARSIVAVGLPMVLVAMLAGGVISLAIKRAPAAPAPPSD